MQSLVLFRASRGLTLGGVSIKADSFLESLQQASVVTMIVLVVMAMLVLLPVLEAVLKHLG